MAFTRLATWLSTPPDERAEEEPQTLAELAAELGVSTRTLQRWRHDPAFGDVMWEHCGRLIEGRWHTIITAQIREAERGSLAHAQWLAQLRDRWHPKPQPEAPQPMHILAVSPKPRPLPAPSERLRRHADTRRAGPPLLGSG
ncbi:MAG: hypothetical protein CL878_15445 [Dehalococcoidia bacterium]|nr:hypothetical protein [Dehalococcoidia bacterium]